MGFIRSNLISNNPYQIEVGEQANTVTSYLDLSTIYGSNYDRMRHVRSFNGGRLKMDVKNILPLEYGNYFSGDDDSIQNPLIAIFHSLFIRNHNHIADKLGSLNRHWDEEKLFYETRKINIALYQKFIYEEWLDLFLGESIERLKNAEYDENVDGSTLNEFSNAAFRIFHAFVPAKFDIRDNVALNFSDLLNKIELLNFYYDDVLNSISHQKMNLDGYSNEILNRMYKNHNKIGLDLLSMDIMRGRDHGIPAYHKFRKFCNVMPHNVKVFNDLAPIISSKSIVQLRQTYKTVYDIDLLVGGALEVVESDEKFGFFGPTLQCIVAEQFYRFKAGDFYFYSNNSTFEENQLEVLKNYKFANFLCENSNLAKTLMNSFVYNGGEINCRDVNRLDLSLWQEHFDSYEDN